MRFVGRLLLAVFSLVLVVFFALFWLVERQGHRSEFWQTFQGAEVSIDDLGIPTVEAADWPSVIEAEGYVVASDRLWQMDLIRRKSGGRLSEWFGEAAFANDKKVQLEDRQALVSEGAEALPADQRTFCEAYARGVNRFINENPYKWGLEYILLGQKPEAWRCADSLLVILEMIETLTAKGDRDRSEAIWREALPPSWANLLFTQSHPWNKPLFGKAPPPAPMPPPADYLPQMALPNVAAPSLSEGNGAGSNNWAWRGKTGCFLANDPHLGHSVPGVWYSMRLKVSERDWSVGMAIPGIPGVTIGMNPFYAWAFTNTGEDIDDDVAETVSEGGKKYLSASIPDKEEWLPVTKKIFLVKVKGEERPRAVEGNFTRRGPLMKQEEPKKGYYSREWLALKPGMLRLPTLRFMRAKDWDEFNAAADEMRLPAQNVLFLSRTCDIGLRVTGTGVTRRTSDSISLLPPEKGAWLGVEDSADRHRLFLPKNAGAAHLASANQRIWVDNLNHSWYSDDREDRINEVLGSRDDLTRDDMSALQRDTQGRFRRELLQWIAVHADSGSREDALLIDQFKAWDGNSRSSSKVFAMSTHAEQEMVKILLGHVTEHYLSKETQNSPYTGTMRHAWLLTAMNAPDGFLAFGISDQALATYLLHVLSSSRSQILPHQETNRWSSQHPFVGRIPVIDFFFKVTNGEQWGAADLVNAERPTFGPSVRLVWDMSQPEASTWIMPVGQSGHIGSAHYKDMQRFWFADKTRPIFSEGEKAAWGF